MKREFFSANLTNIHLPRCARLASPNTTTNIARDTAPAGPPGDRAVGCAACVESVEHRLLYKSGLGGIGPGNPSEEICGLLRRRTAKRCVPITGEDVGALNPSIVIKAYEEEVTEIVEEFASDTEGDGAEYVLVEFPEYDCFTTIGLESCATYHPYRDKSNEKGQHEGDPSPSFLSLQNKCRWHGLDTESPALVVLRSDGPESTVEVDPTDFDYRYLDHVKKCSRVEATGLDRGSVGYDARDVVAVFRGQWCSRGPRTDVMVVTAELAEESWEGAAGRDSVLPSELPNVFPLNYSDDGELNPSGRNFNSYFDSNNSMPEPVVGEKRARSPPSIGTDGTPGPKTVGYLIDGSRAGCEMRPAALQISNARPVAHVLRMIRIL